MLRFPVLSRTLAVLAMTIGFLASCGPTTDGPEPTGGPAPGPAAPAATSAPEPPQPTDNGVYRDVAPDERVLVMVEGPSGEREERWMSAEDAEREGYTVIDLSNDWTPFLFAEHRDAEGRLLPNRYRRVFIGLANDRLDGDGEPLEPGQKNYLELYGIFPSLSVLRERFLEDEERSCITPEDQEALRAVKSVAWVSPSRARRDARRLPKVGSELERARQRAGVATLAELAEKKPALAAKVKRYERWSKSTAAIAAAERRLICEGFLADAEENAKKPRRLRHSPGMHDEALRQALRHFQQKHMIYDGHSLRPRTVTVLSQSTLENDHAALLRALRERVVAAADIIEDGSTHGKKGPPTFVSVSGEELPIRNLADEYTQAAVAQLGLDTPEGALEFFKRHDAKEFEDLRVGAKLGPRPEYYAPHMDLSIVVDRGDVWYDPPFDDQDKWKVQWRRRYPTLTLYLDYQGRKLPLVRWRTTIGGWRSEQASNGYEYYKYKGSDTGRRVIRKVVSGPVWIAPESTPIRSLVKSKKVEGRWQSIVNYDELGPGYLSAYGVVAGYFVIPGEGDEPDVDRGIRAHGSSNYLSIYSAAGYSHGCHRLPNHLAIRLYDFLLRHRMMQVKGDTPMDFSRQFLWHDHVYDMRIPSRGFEFELDPPVPVNVLEGTIRGTLKEPIEGLVPKPGKRYPPPPPEEGEEPLEGEPASPVDAVTTASGRIKTTAAAKGTP